MTGREMSTVSDNYNTGYSDRGSDNTVAVTLKSVNSVQTQINIVSSDLGSQQTVPESVFSLARGSATISAVSESELRYSSGATEFQRGFRDSAFSLNVNRERNRMENSKNTAARPNRERELKPSLIASDKIKKPMCHWEIGNLGNSMDIQGRHITNRKLNWGRWVDRYRLLWRDCWGVWNLYVKTVARLE
ncbi:hypothetical protein J6590_070507 [Homalodisca vitripennis]|nr:hypothetical protein J6590_070507 [Homalodisca vitripennis]